jgi:hypothetical protein
VHATELGDSNHMRRLALILAAVAATAWGCADAGAPPPRQHGHQMSLAGTYSDHAARKTDAWGRQHWCTDPRYGC